MGFRREYELRLTATNRVGQNIYQTYQFSTPVERDEFILDNKSIFVKHGITIQFHDIEISMAGRVYRYYLRSGAEIDEEIDHEEKVKTNLFVAAGRYNFDDVGRVIKILAEHYVVSPQSDKMWNIPKCDDLTRFLRGDRRRTLAEYELLLGTGKCRSTNIREKNALNSASRSNPGFYQDKDLIIGNLLFEDGSKLYVVNPDNSRDQPLPYQISLILWNGHHYLL